MILIIQIAPDTELDRAPESFEVPRKYVTATPSSRVQFSKPTQNHFIDFLLKTSNHFKFYILNETTARSRVLPEKLKVPAFCKTRNFIIVFTTLRHHSLS